MNEVKQLEKTLQLCARVHKAEEDEQNRAAAINSVVTLHDGKCLRIRDGRYTPIDWTNVTDI